MLMLVHLLSLSIFVAVKCTAEQRELEGEDTPLKTTGRHIVVLRDDIDEPHLAALISDIRKADKDPFLPNVHCTIHNVMTTLSKILVVTASEGALKKLNKMEEVSFIEEDKIVEGAGNPHLSWALDRLDQQFLPLDQQYQPTANGNGVDVYVVDTGIYYAHSEFGGRASFGGFDKVPLQTTAGNGSDCHGHGTHVASVIGGKTFGVAKQVKLYSIRVLSCNNRGWVSDLVSALESVAKRVLQTRNPSVINLSLSGPHSMPLDKAIQNLYDMGVPMVTAAGNGKSDACQYSPASSPLVLTVGATSIDDSPYFYAEGPGTNFGSCVDVFAPGYYVLGASLKCNSCCRTWSGTSMATGLVSGIIALYLEKNPSMTTRQIYDRVINDATDGAVKLTLDRVPFNLINQTVTKLAKTEGGCGGKLVYETQGHLYSPNYPLNYPNKLYCTWRIIARIGEEVKVAIEEISLAQNHVLTITDGNSSSPNVLARLSGDSSARKRYRSKSHVVTITLTTTGSGNGKGFKLKYTKHLAGEKTLAEPSIRPYTPTPAPLPTSQPVTEVYDSKVFLKVINKKIQTLVEEWEKKKFYVKHIQPTQSINSNGKLRIAYNIIFTNLSLDESYCVFEANSTELLQHYQSSRKHHIITEITQVLRDNKLLYSAIFTRKNNRTEKHLGYWNDTLTEHEERMKRMRRRGYLLKAQTFTHYSGHYSISSIYTEIKREWFTEYNLTVDESLRRTKIHRGAYVMTSISAYLLNGKTKFAVIFEAVNHPDYTLWTIWDRSAKFTREVITNYTASASNYEATGIVGFQIYDEIRYIITLGHRTNYYD